MPSKNITRVRARTPVHHNEWFEIEAREIDGFASPYYVLSAADYVTVLPIAADGTAYFVRQYRPAIDAMSLELPSGHVDPGETPAQAVVRELYEETGCTTLALSPLGPLASNTGRMSNQLWAFVAKVHKVAECEQGIALHPCPVRDIMTMIAEAQLRHALDLAVIMKAAAAGFLPLEGQVGRSVAV
jgi:ADP-ribose pyrophosphatase